MIKKQHVLSELREIFGIIVYLFVSFSVLATFKSLILIQASVNNFVHGYTQALITSLALGKIVFLAQKLPILNALRNQPVLYSAIYKAFLFTIITTAASRLEEMLFASKLMEQVDAIYPVLAYMTHELGMFLVFFVLFSFREMDAVLGAGRVREIFLAPRPEQQ
jgi:hypothetical protein